VFFFFFFREMGALLLDGRASGAENIPPGWGHAVTRM